MLPEDKIKSLIETVSKRNIPQWRQDYMARICRNLQVHTKGLLFSKITSLFPNENPESRNYCIDTYEPITKGSIWKAINNISRIFGNSSFDIQCSENTAKYINEAFFEGKNLFTFFLEKWIEQVVATDPNAACAIYPDGYTNDRVRIIKSNRIVYVDDKEGLFCFISEEESEVEFFEDNVATSREVFYDAEVGGMNGKTCIQKTFNQKISVKIVKPVYHLFTKESLIRFTIEDRSAVWEQFPYPYEHKLVPAFRLNSVELMQGVQESFVAPFIPFGNLALLQHRNHRAVDLMFSYPRMSEVQTPCDNVNCNGGVITTDAGKISCSRCGGDGWITVQSPFKVYKKNINTGFADPEVTRSILNTPPVEFYTPDTGILNYSKDSWKEYLSLGEEAVYVQQKLLTGNVESARAKEIGNEDEYTWIQNISKAFNSDLTRVCQAFENYIHTSPVTVSIEQPTSFAIVPEGEAFDALDMILKSSAPIFLKAQKVESFVQKFISRSSPIIKALRVLKEVDPLLFYTSNEIQTFKSNNIVTAEMWSTHVFAYPMLMKLYRADAKLFDKEDSRIVELLQAEIPEPEPTDLKSALLNQ